MPAPSNLADIVAKLPLEKQVEAAVRLSKYYRAFHKQDEQDLQVAGSLDRLLSGAPSEALREIAKKLRKRIKEISRGNVVTGVISMLNPGDPSKSTGPKYPVTHFDSLRLPNNKTIGETSNEELRPLLHRLGIEGAHTEGRNVIAERYAAHISKIGKAGADAAITDWLSKNRG